METYQEKLDRLRLLEQKVLLREELPHLHGWPWYPWAKRFFESTNHYNFLCAANQISKSSTQIRKCIDWATNTDKWPMLWRQRPLQFWYLYPTRDVATIEFEKKWVPQFLPKGSFKEHPKFGWREKYQDQKIYALHFHSGVSVYFKTYGQDVKDLQTGTVDAMFLDEELPEELYSELNMRITASNGYFHMVFTATLGQEFWRETIEERGKNEKFPLAFKEQISMYDCLEYEDGSQTPWSKERIEEITRSCKNTAEIQRRVYGRFVVDGGLKYPCFERERNLKEGHPLPRDWKIYAGVDIGGGGEGHPSAIVFVGVSPDYKKGRVFRGWRGDHLQTTASDVFHKFTELKENLVCTGQFYDWHNKDFGTIATRLGEPFVAAEKSHDLGEQVLNTLFKNEMLIIYDEPELRKLAAELCTLKKETHKTKAKDDFSDALRYAVTKIPWDWSALQGKSLTPKKGLNHREREIQERRAGFEDPENDEDLDLSVFQPDEELDAYNELYEVE